MADKRFLIIVILFGIMTVGGIIEGLLKTPIAKLRYDRLWPFVLGLLWSFLAFDSYKNGKPTTIIFISVLGVAALWRVLNPIRFRQDDVSTDPAKWKWGMFYYNKEDKRIFPPRASINFANPFSIGVLILLLIGVVMFCGTWIK